MKNYKIPIEQMLKENKPQADFTSSRKGSSGEAGLWTPGQQLF